MKAAIAKARPAAEIQFCGTTRPPIAESWHGLRHDLKPSPGMGDHANQEQQVQRERPRGLQKIEPGFIGARAAREADDPG